MASSTSNLSSYDSSAVPDGAGFAIGIVRSEWNEAITGALEEGCMQVLLEHGVNRQNMVSIRVPGSYELPMGALNLLNTYDVDAVICLGCVIKGETRHDEYIAQAVAKGLMDLNLEFELPVIFGLLTTENQQQAVDRAGGKHGNKGVECAITALKMIDLQKRLETQTSEN